MNANIYILKFCGMFDVDEKQKRELLKSEKFAIKRINADSIGDYNDWRYVNEQYYPNFRRFISNESPSIDGFTILSDDIILTKKKYNKVLQNAPIVSSTVSFIIKSVEIFLFKKSPGIISLDIQIDTDSLDLNIVTAFINQTRNYSSKIIETDTGTELEMLHLIQDKILNNAVEKNKFNLSYQLAEQQRRSFKRGGSLCIADYRGSKLKVFQCFNLKDKPDLDFGQMLFSLGTLTPITKDLSEADYNTHSKQYHMQTVSDCISVYNNWAALCLFDTFTMVGHNYLTEPMTLKTWQTTYFRIFVYNLYYKYYLFSINSEKLYQREALKKQRQELNEFIQIYDTPYISYNFLPNLIHEKIRNGIKAGEETDKLRNKVEWMTGLINEEKRDLTSDILFCLAVFAILPSNMKDLYENNFNWANIVALFIKILVLLCIYLYYRMISRKR